MNYWFEYDTSTGQIQNQPMLAETNPWTNPPTTWSVLGSFNQDTATSLEIMAYTYPERFLVEGSPAVLVEQPYFTVTAVTSTTVAGQWTLTATLNNPPSTPPTEATFTIAGQTETATITNSQATLTVDIHPSVANVAISVTASATGCATSRTSTIGGTQAASTSLQVYTPTSGNPTIAPTGAGSKSFLDGYFAGQTASIQSLLADIVTIIDLMLDVQFKKFMPALQSAIYTPVTLDADETSALSDIQANLLPKLYTTLKNAYPSGGTQQRQYSHFVTDHAGTYTNRQDYDNDVATTPNLA